MKAQKSNIARNLSALRQFHKYSQEDVAERVGVSRQAVAKWENGESVPDIINCDALAQLYDVELSDLIDNDQVPFFDEVTALTFAGAYADEQGFELVCHRAELMADAAEKNPGAMRAVVKLDAATVERLAAEAGEAWPVNYNSPLQTVVAGTAEACEKLDLLVKEAKGRAMKVAVSGAFHSPFMAEAERGLAAYLADGHAPAEPSVPVLANRTADAYPADEAGRVELLSSQVANPVQWVRTLEAMAAMGVDTFIEVGPGKTLTGLVARTLEGVTALPCETAEQLEAVLAALSEKGE